MPGVDSSKSQSQPQSSLYTLRPLLPPQLTSAVFLLPPLKRRDCPVLLQGSCWTHESIFHKSCEQSRCWEESKGQVGRSKGGVDERKGGGELKWPRDCKYGWAATGPNFVHVTATMIVTLKTDHKTVQCHGNFEQSRNGHKLGVIFKDHDDSSFLFPFYFSFTTLFIQSVFRV